MNAIARSSRTHVNWTGACRRPPSSRHFAHAFAAAMLLAAAVAEARITSITVDCTRSQSPSMCPGQSPTFGAMSFGTVGQYEKIRGTAKGELDPLHPRNSIITDLELAPRNAAGKA